MSVVDLDAAVRVVEVRWGLDTSGSIPIVDGVTATIRLPAAGMAVHISRTLVSPLRVQALQTARARLAERGVPVVALVPSTAGSFWEGWDDQFIEVEPWVDHDGRMNTWDGLRKGAPVLAAIHNAWSGLDLGSVGEACDWANWISPPEVAANADTAKQRLTHWGLHDLASDVHRLSELTAVDVPLSRQVVHGDFWDNNVYLRGGDIVAVTDFDFLGRRPRIDDLALLLYFADEQPYFDGVGQRTVTDRLADLAPLVDGYGRGLDQPLTDAELTALPYALARQPLWTYAKRILEVPHLDHARRDAIDTAPAVRRALDILDNPEAWSHAFGSRAMR